MFLDETKKALPMAVLRCAPNSYNQLAAVERVMNHLETVDAIVDLASTGQQISADEALGVLVKLIQDMSPASRNYDARLASLMQIGATLWNLSEVIRHSRLEIRSLPV